MLKRLILIVAALIVIPAVVVGSWATTHRLLEATGGEAFCRSCHTMAPFADTYRDDVHGGNNTRGLVAQCTDCHLPHDGAIDHLTAKVRTGAHDAWRQLSFWVGLNEIDWEAKRAERGRYVFDSGCLQCHAALDREGQPHAVIHRRYFEASGQLQCVTCHTKVGHKDLDQALKTLAEAASQR